MVGEKNKDTVHDFDKDPIELVVKGNFLTANGTTLGADNGVAIATNLAIMEDRSLEHGPLEFLFTIDEETGLTGANNLQPDFVKSRILLNLDSEEEGILYVGCAGGQNTTASWKAVYETAPANYTPTVIKVRGLKGGHSGAEIDKGRGDSIKILNRVLLALEKVNARVSSIEGGNKSNAIPREAEAIVFIPSKKLNEASGIVSQGDAIIRAEIESVDPKLSIVMEEIKSKKNSKVFKKPLQIKIMKTISALPHGVIKMSADIPNLVETSTNVAIIRSDAKKVEIITSQRSSVASEIREIGQTVASVFTLGGAELTVSDAYPGWKVNLESPILKVAKQTYTSLFGKEPEVKAIHAGLECGIIGEKYEGMDMLSMGPTMEGVHTPEEKLHIDTVEKYWKYLLTILKNVQ